MYKNFLHNVKHNLAPLAYVFIMAFVRILQFMNSFDFLPLSEKVRILKHTGDDPICIIAHEQATVYLYRINGFLVEKHVDNNSKKTLKLQSAAYTDLFKYLPHITIESLHKLIH
jgi:hypothetical protein